MDDPSKTVFRPFGCHCSVGCDFPCAERAGVADACEQCGCDPFTEAVLTPEQLDLRKDWV